MRFGRCFAAFLFVSAVGAHGHVYAQAAGSTDTAAPQAKAPKLDLDSASLSSHWWTPKLNDAAAKPNDSILSGLDLGGSTLTFQGDKKLPENLSGAEMIEPGTMMTKKQRRLGGPHYFGLSIKKTLE